MSPPDDVVAIADGGNEHRVEEDRPDAIVGLVEADVSIDEGVGDVQGRFGSSLRSHLTDAIAAELGRHMATASTNWRA